MVEERFDEVEAKEKALEEKFDAKDKELDAKDKEHDMHFVDHDSELLYLNPEQRTVMTIPINRQTIFVVQKSDSSQNVYVIPNSKHFQVEIPTKRGGTPSSSSGASSQEDE